MSRIPNTVHNENVVGKCDVSVAIAQTHTFVESGQIPVNTLTRDGSQTAIQ